MERRVPPAAVLIVAIIAIAGLYALALIKDIDGALFMPVCAVIALIAGIKLPDFWNGQK